MSYNTGIFSKFAFSSSVSSIIADQNVPIFAPPSGSIFSNVSSLRINPAITPTGGTVTNAISLQVNSPVGAVNNYSLFLSGSAPVGFGATSSSSYFLIGATVSNTAITSMIRGAGVVQSASNNSNPSGILEQTTFSPPSGTSYGTASGVNIAPTRGGAGTVSNLWNLIVNQPTGGSSATISNVCADFKGLTYHENGITFGAPGIGGYPNSGADVLKFYVENGTWTPSVGGSTTPGTGTYTTRTGYYHRIGGMVFVDAVITWTAIAGGAGSMQVQSLPFTVRNLTNYQPMTIPNVQNINGGGGFNYFALRFNANTTNASLLSVRNNNTNVAIALDTAGTIVFSGMYLI